MRYLKQFHTWSSSNILVYFLMSGMQAIPVVVKTPALSQSQEFYGILSTWKKKDWQDGEVLSHCTPEAQQSCAVLWVCRSAVSPGSLCGTCCRAGSRSPPSCRWLTATPAHPTHTAALSMESQCPGPWAEHKPAWFSYLFSSDEPNQPNLTKFQCYWCAPKPPLGGLTKSGLAPSRGTCLLSSSCCSTAPKTVAQNFL